MATFPTRFPVAAINSLAVQCDGRREPAEQSTKTSLYEVLGYALMHARPMVLGARGTDARAQLAAALRPGQDRQIDWPSVIQGIAVLLQALFPSGVRPEGETPVEPEVGGEG